MLTQTNHSSLLVNCLLFSAFFVNVWCVLNVLTVCWRHCRRVDGVLTAISMTRPVWFWLSGVKCHNVFIVLDEQEPVGELTHESGSTALPQNSTVHGILDQKMSKSPWGNSPTKAVPQHCHKIQHLHKCHTLQYQTTQNYTGSFGPWYWITQNQTTILQHFVRVWYWTTQNQTEPPVWFCVVWGS